MTKRRRIGQTDHASQLVAKRVWAEIKLRVPWLNPDRDHQSRQEEFIHRECDKVAEEVIALALEKYRV